MGTTVLDDDTTARACRSAIWISLVEAQRVGWPDVLETLYALHSVVDARIRGADYARWCDRLADEGPHQGATD